MKLAVASGLAIVSLCVLCGAQSRTRSDLTGYLPRGAKLELPVVWTQLGPGTPEQAVVFYSAPGRIPSLADSHVTVLQQADTGMMKLWTLNCQGAYTGFMPDTGVYDINHTGRPKIVVDCEGTTVCPNFFGIFEYQDGKIQPVRTDFRPLETCHVELKDLDGDGIPEIINHPRPPFSLPEIYHWDGSHFAKANARYPHFWGQYGAHNYAMANSLPQPLPLYVMMDACRAAFKVFKLAQRAAKARDPCIRAKERIASGRAVVEASSADYPRLQRHALAEIDALLAKINASK